MSEVTENPRGGCVLAGINAVLSAVDRVCPVYHAGPGCCMQTCAAAEGQSCGRNAAFLSSVSIPSTNMLEREVVFGGADKLRTTIQGAMEIIDADAYFVLTGCTAGINGDDIQSVVSTFKNAEKPVYAIETPGFAGNDMLGYETVINTFIEKSMVKGPKQKNLVNLLGIVPYHDPYWSGTIEEFTRILRELGLEVNTFFSERQGMDTIRRAGSATLNIIIHPWLLRGAEKRMSEQFNIPALRIEGMPVGATDTSEFVRQVGKVLSLDPEKVESVIQKEEEYVYGYFEQAIGKLSWKRFAVVADSNYAIGFTRFLANDYSFTPLMTIVSEPLFRDKDRSAVKERITNLEYARAPAVYFATDQYDIEKLLEADDEITLLIGSTNERETSSRKGCQCSVLSYPVTDKLVFNRTYSGYRGCLTLVEDLYDDL
jgi:nitrogenase molybdenum-iron protein beta chain